MEMRKIEAEVGPLKYIAALIYGDSPDQSLLESAVRIVIMMIVFVFDPLAVLLLIAANWSLKNNRPKDIEKVIITPAVVRKEEAPTYVPRTAGGPKRAVKGDKSSEEKSA